MTLVVKFMWGKKKPEIIKPKHSKIKTINLKYVGHFK